MGEIIVSEGGKHNFLSVRLQEDGKWIDDYYFLTYKFTENDDLVLWLPNIDTFEEAIENEQLQGIINKEKCSTNITITSNPEKLFKFINDPSNLNLFDYIEPILPSKSN